MVLAGTNEGYEWVVGQWWETIKIMIDSGRGNCRLERSRAKVLEEHLQENKDVRDFCDNSWQ